MNDSLQKLEMGRLERVALRDFWLDEAREFTPWLALPENIELLSAAIGIDLEVQGQEQGVGPFRADILCKDTRNGHYVLVENQLERTDHGHLGQLLTYSAGLDAVTAVWISSRFTDEHRAALDWLNSYTAEGLNFFGLEVELWKIGSSAVAPKFNVVSQPNDWSKTVKTTASGSGISATQQAHLDFWTQFKEFMAERGSFVRVNKPSTDQWTTIAVGRSNFSIYLTNGMRDGWSQIYMAMTGPLAKPHFHELQTKFGEEIEERLGKLEWRELPEAKESQISLRRRSTPTLSAAWPELNNWFAENAENWVRVLGPIVKQLSGDQAQSSE